MQLEVMSFNIRCSYGEEMDGKHRWSNRRDYVADLIEHFSPDILGLQEVVEHQRADLCARLEEYDFVGVGRDDGQTAGEYSPVFYKRKRFSKGNSGNFWLSPEPDNIGTIGWDAGCIRMCTWVILTDNVSGQQIFCASTHFDHAGTVARLESAKLVLQKIHELAGDLPVVLLGDFNAEPSEDSIKIITDKENPQHLEDARVLSALHYGPAWTFHDFGKLELDKRNLIDYIFVRGIKQVTHYATLDEKRDKLWPSDHTPIMARLEL